MRLFPWSTTVVVAMAITLLGQPALAQTSGDAAWHVRDEQRIEVDGTPLALSPDGTWIDGLGPERGTFCVWEVETLEPTCEGELRTPVLERSVTWAPDSTAVAFSLDTPLVFRDSDIYVFEVEAGTLENLTEDDPDGTGADDLQLGDDAREEIPVDLYPAWSPDSRDLIFARTMWGGEGDYETLLMTIPRSGGESEEVAPITPNFPLSVVSPMVWQEDGTILLAIWPGETDDPQNGIWRVSQDGDFQRVIPGAADDEVPLPLLADVTSDGERASIVSLPGLGSDPVQPGTVFYELAIEEGEVQPWEEVLDLETEQAAAYQDDSTGVLAAPPVFSPDDSAVAFMTRTTDNAMHVSILDGTEISRDIYTITAAEETTDTLSVKPSIAWSENNTLLVISASGTVLLTVEQ